MCNGSLAVALHAASVCAVGVYLVNGLVLIRCELVGRIKSQQLLHSLPNYLAGSSKKKKKYLNDRSIIVFLSDIVLLVTINSSTLFHSAPPPPPKTPQGIIGNDSRHYALDLFRIFPPDANFLVRPEGTRIRHKMAVLRPEMIDTFLR